MVGDAGDISPPSRPQLFVLIAEKAVFAKVTTLVISSQYVIIVTKTSYVFPMY